MVYMEYSIFDVVALSTDIPDAGLVMGMKGVIIDTYSSPSIAYEVEFCDEEGRTIVSLALSAEKLQAV